VSNQRQVGTSRCQACRATQSGLSQQDWQQRYDVGQTGWDRGETNPWLVQLLKAGRLEPCRILIPGCGRGHEAIELAKAGFEVTAIDFAPAAVEHLRNEFTRLGLAGSVIQTDVFSFCEPNPFDAIYEQTCLCAIHPDQWQTYQQLLACWLRPLGSLHALFMQSGQSHQPPFTCDVEAMRNLFCEPNWIWTTEPTQVPHPTGMYELACTIQRGTE
jgi:SAM-dependent methyltransferase